MKYIEIITNTGDVDTISAIAEKIGARDFRLGAVSEDGLHMMRLLITDNKLQLALDNLQKVLQAKEEARIIVLPVEVSLPKSSEEQRKEEDGAIETREFLYEEVEKNARLDINFIVLLSLSTIVAAIGLIENNVAVLVGAMVIAPLLSPNLAFGLGTALGDIPLMKKAAITTFSGILLAIFLSLLIGLLWPFDMTGSELLARTKVGMDSVILALASGTAAAVSLTSRSLNVLVGVMVAVALLPPAATMGLMLAQGQLDYAIGAGLQLAINIVCVNLASKIVFFLRGIRPRIWWKKETAKRKMVTYLLVWFITLIILILIIYLYNYQ